MTTVAISLSEMRRFQPSPQGRNRARRSLFGSVDHEETQRLLHRELDRITRQDSRRWNFDFTNESPLPGRYAWEPVNDGEATSSRVPSLSQVPPSEANPSSEEEEPTRPSTSTSATSTNDKKQTRMTDFLQSRKRKSISKVSEQISKSVPETTTTTMKKTRFT